MALDENWMQYDLSAERESGDYQFLGDSTCIAAAKFSMVNKTLTIRFEDGSEYEYYGVHPFVWYNLNRVTSRGWFFNKNIRNAGYEFSRIS
jgi:hypothetical protein